MTDPVHSAGHLAYAKSAQLYIQQMDDLSEKNSADQLKQFTTSGYFTICRSEHFWSGNFTDQTIEQELMRLLKTSGGITHGRGITDSSLMKWVNALPHTIPICDALEKFTGTHATTSDQHKDLRASNAARDSRDCEVFQKWLRDHSPFAHSDRDSLVSVATGTVADKTVNCDNAYAIGLQAAATVVDKSYTVIKLSRKDRVISISGSKDKVTVRDQEAVINPTLLFMRKSCTIKDPFEMEQYMDYELSTSPPSLFDSGGMRKTDKSVLGAILKSSTVHFSEPPEKCKICDRWWSFTSRSRLAN